jgi:hypothetical protein
MPAVSKDQRKFMAICEHHPEHARGECPDMTREQLHEFASTKEADLPDRKGDARETVRRYNRNRRRKGNEDRQTAALEEYRRTRAKQ